MKALPTKADVVIIGGGIIGVCIAYYLVKKGVKDVLLLERGMLGEGSTGKCAGGIRTQFSTEINIRFTLSSRLVFDHFQEEFGVDPEFHPIGYLLLAVSDRHWEIMKKNAELMGGMGLEVELLGRDEIKRRWPMIRVDDLAGGSFTEGDGYAGPNEVLQGFARGARRLGAVLREGAEVTGIQVEKGRVQSVETSSGECVATSTLVNAAGPRATRVAAMAGLDLPVRPLRRQIFFTDPVEEIPPNLPMVIDLEYGWYVRGEGAGFLIAGPQDSESSFHEEVDFEGKEWAVTRSLHRMPGLEKTGIASGWAGLYAISPDHHAIIGPFPEMQNFICANGFSGHGFQHGPTAGISVAEIIVDGRATTLDTYPLRPERFREGDLIYEPMTAFRAG